MDTDTQTNIEMAPKQGGSSFAVLIVIIIIVLGGIYFWYMKSAEKMENEKRMTSESAMTDEALQKDLEASGSVDIESDLEGLDEVYR